MLVIATTIYDVATEASSRSRNKATVMLDEHWMFLAVQNSSIGDLVCLSVCLTELTIRDNQSLHKPTE